MSGAGIFVPSDVSLNKVYMLKNTRPYLELCKYRSQNPRFEFSSSKQFREETAFQQGNKSKYRKLARSTCCKEANLESMID
jgi:hypothetical protein